ncbi:MAG TPA: hypothetical protein VMV49_05520 [Candidatus Deferrimicrobium sp.]|nr:hypothetical protein [Candidatus Deferrimicrobium sp.]
MGFLGDLINRPTVAIETIKEKRSLLKFIILLVAIGACMMTNFFLSHFVGGFPTVLIFILILCAVGILLELFFVMGFTVDFYIVLKLTKYKPAGDMAKTVMWCVLVPSFIYHFSLLLVNLLLMGAGLIEVTGYLYDTLKYLMYIWILGLCCVAVSQNQPEHKFRYILCVIGTFILNWIIWVYLNTGFFSLIFSLFS